jgi:O-antigen/teichoic acid export membrane protein
VVSVLAAIVGSAILALRFGPPRFVASLLRSTAAEGLGFSFAGSTQAVYNDIDKSMLSHYGMNVENGIYTMAYRLADLANIPITALDAAALPRYFRQSKEGFRNVRALSSRLAKRAALVGLVMAGCLFLGAPLIPRVLGSDFGASVLALRWLCLLPAFRGIHQLTGSAITGLGFQRYRTWAQLAAATLNFGLNLWLIPAHGWLGAAWASLATDGTLGVVNLMVLRSLRESSVGTAECSTFALRVDNRAL